MQEVASEWSGSEKEFVLTVHGTAPIAVVADSPRSTDLVLAGLLSCSGRTLLTILERMRLTLDGLKLRVTCEREPEPPKVFTRIDLYYEIWPGSTPVDRIERALELTEKHCTVYNILKHATPIHIHPSFHEGREADDQGGVGAVGGGQG